MLLILGIMAIVLTDLGIKSVIEKADPSEKIGACLVLGGGISNLYDRLKRGYVVDYFSIRFKKLKKIVFNLGDICIFLGAGILLAAQIVESVREH